MQPSLCRMLSDLEAYVLCSPEQAELAREFAAFARSHPSVFERSHASAHFTGSAWVVSGDGQRVLLMHHRKLGRWLQPGGHADGDFDLARVALREAEEETGLKQLHPVDGIFDLDRHWIPARPTEPAHWHYDVRYVIRAGRDERYMINPESHALAWRPVLEVAEDAELDPSLHRMAGKWLSRNAHA